MELENTRDVLQQAMEQQYQDRQKAIDANRILADEKTMYQNEARGTLYSGMPTWERAQNAMTAAQSLDSLNTQYAENKVKVWNSIQNALDKITAYNEAAAEYEGAAAAPTAFTTTPVATTAPFFMNGKYYQYVDGQLKEVQ